MFLLIKEKTISKFCLLSQTDGTIFKILCLNTYIVFNLFDPFEILLFIIQNIHTNMYFNSRKTFKWIHSTDSRANDENVYEQTSMKHFVINLFVNTIISNVITSYDSS